MPAAEAQQARCAVRRIKQPVLEGVVGGTTHQQRLAGEKVQGGQRAVMRILKPGITRLKSKQAHVHTHAGMPCHRKLDTAQATMTEQTTWGTCI